MIEAVLAAEEETNGGLELGERPRDPAAAAADAAGGGRIRRSQRELRQPAGAQPLERERRHAGGARGGGTVAFVRFIRAGEARVA